MGDGEFYFPLKCPKVFLRKYVQKLASLIWKLFTLLLLGVSGIFMCFLGVDQRISVGKSIQDFSLENKTKKKTNHTECQQPNTHSFVVHDIA
jgi:hypothetical protein